jgi:hypothetical protein
MKRPISAPSSARGSLTVERASGGGAGAGAAPYTPTAAAASASTAHTATRYRRPSELSDVPDTDCVFGQPAAPHVRSWWLRSVT